MHKLDEFYMRLVRERAQGTSYSLNQNDYSYQQLLRERQAYLESVNQAQPEAKVVRGLNPSDSAASAAQKASENIVQNYVNQFVNPYLNEWLEKQQDSRAAKGQMRDPASAAEVEPRYKLYGTSFEMELDRGVRSVLSFTPNSQTLSWSFSAGF